MLARVVAARTLLTRCMCGCMRSWSRKSIAAMIPSQVRVGVNVIRVEGSRIKASALVGVCLRTGSSVL